MLRHVATLVPVTVSVRHAHSRCGCVTLYEFRGAAAVSFVHLVYLNLFLSVSFGRPGGPRHVWSGLTPSLVLGGTQVHTGRG